MKVYLPAMEGHVPVKMVHTVHNLIEFSYLVHCNVHNTQSLEAVDAALKSFHTNREIFRTSRVLSHFNYPCQHSLKHYVTVICAYGSPNDLCSSMTEINISKLSRNLGGTQIAIRQCDKCFLPTNGSTSFQHLARTSHSIICLKVTAYLMFSDRSVSYVYSFIYTLSNIDAGQLQSMHVQDNEDEIAEDSDAEECQKHLARAAVEDEDDKDEYDVDGLRVIADIVMAKTIGAFIFQ